MENGRNKIVEELRVMLVEEGVENGGVIRDIRTQLIKVGEKGG